MKSEVRSIRERIASTEFEARKVELRVFDLEDAMADKRKCKEQFPSTWGHANEFYLEDLEIQLNIEKLTLFKIVHHLKYLQEELARHQ